jgi:hypothetical protein
MARCKFCDARIEWERDEDNQRWVPMEPDSEGERHECRSERPQVRSEYRERSIECTYCGNDIVFREKEIQSKNPGTGEMESVIRKLPHDADDPSKSHNCAERRQAWLVEQESRTGRSEVQLCKNGCGALVFWNYDARSKFNNKPLPYEQASNPYHKCPKYNPKRK